MCDFKDETVSLIIEGRGGLKKILICTGTGCVANGAMDVYKAFVQEIQALGLKIVEDFAAARACVEKEKSMYISKSGCQGFCQMGPLVKILPEEVLYNRVKASDVKAIVETTVQHGQILENLLYVDPVTQKRCRTQKDIPFYQRQSRFVLKQCGEINPEDLNEYMAVGGYKAAKKVYMEMTP